MKKRLAASARRVFFSWVLVGGLALPAYAAEPRVLLLEPADAPSGLLPALQIQLQGVAEPESVPQLAAASSAELIQAAGQLARARQALAVVWVDPALGQARASQSVLLYVVGERAGRALVEVVRVPGERGPDLERTLALKLRELITELRRSRQLGPTDSRQLGPTDRLQPSPEPGQPDPDGMPGLLGAPPSAAEPRWARAPAPPSWGAVLSAGARLGSQPRIGLGRWGTTLALGPVLTLPRLRLAGLVAADWFPATQIVRDARRLRFSELGPGLALHAQWRVGAAWLGARTGPQLVWLQVEAATAQQQRAARALFGWAFSLGLDAEWPLSAALALAAELQLQGLGRREHLSVDGRELLDLGRLRLRLGVTLVVRPFR